MATSDEKAKAAAKAKLLAKPAHPAHEIRSKRHPHEVAYKPTGTRVVTGALPKPHPPSVVIS